MTSRNPSSKSLELSASLWLLIICLTALFTSAASIANAAADPEDLVRLRGRVTNSSDQPVGGASVLAVGEWWSLDAPLARSETNPDGSYEITFSKSQYDAVNSAWQTTAVVATAPGFGPAWKRWNDRGPDGTILLSLRPDDVPINGHLVDLEGRPVQGAKVQVDYLIATAPDLKSVPISGLDPSETGGFYNPQLPGFVLGHAQFVTTQSDGGFHITGVGCDRTAVLSFVGPGIAHTSARFQTRNVPTQTRAFQPDAAANANVLTAYGANSNITAEPGRRVIGIVTDADTHAPLAGVTLKITPLSLKVVTDNDGRYRLEGIPKKKGFRLSAAPAEDQPYIACEHDIPSDPGLAPITIDFQLHRGLWITGKVTDKITGKPVHTGINYLPYLTNPYARALPEFHDEQTPSGAGVHYTKADGSFRVAGLPGPALVVAWFSKQPHVHGVGADKVRCPMYRGLQYQVYAPFPVSSRSADAIADINVPEAAKDTTVNFQLDPGATIHMEIVDPSGNPLKGVVVSPAPPGESTLDRRDTSTFDALALKPGEPRDYCFRDDAHNLGKAIVVNASDAPDQNLRVTLEPLGTFTGRLIGVDGLPVSDARIDAWTNLCNTSTDAQGRFTITLLTGHEYNLVGVKRTTHFATDANRIKVSPGATNDLGDVHMKPY